MSVAWSSSALLAPLALTQAAAQDPAPWQEALLAKVPAGLTVGAELRPRSNRSAFAVRSSLAWSADGRQVAYVGRREEEWHPVLGARVGEAYDYVSNPTFAGEHAFFMLGRTLTEHSQRAWVWVDGELLRAEDWMADIGVRADGKRVAYWAQPGAHIGDGVAPVNSRPELVVASEKSGHWSFERGESWIEAPMVPPVFTANGARVLTTAQSRKGWVVLQSSGGRETELTEPQTRIDAFSVSENGAALAFVRSDAPLENSGPIPSAAEHAELFFKGKRVGRGHVGITLPTVDARGEHVAYALTIDGRRSVAVDDEKRLEGRFEHVDELCFDPPGEELAFVGNRGGSPSSKAQGSFEGGTSCVLVRPVTGLVALEEQPSFLEVRDLVWDAAGERLAYCARDDGGWRVVCGTQKSAPHDEVGAPRFAADGKTLGFGSREGDKLWWRVLALE